MHILVLVVAVVVTFGSLFNEKNGTHDYEVGGRGASGWETETRGRRQWRVVAGIGVGGSGASWLGSGSAAAAGPWERKGLGVGEYRSSLYASLGALAARRLEPRGSVAGFKGLRHAAVPHFFVFLCVSVCSCVFL